MEICYCAHELNDRYLALLITYFLLRYISFNPRNKRYLKIILFGYVPNCNYDAEFVKTCSVSESRDNFQAVLNNLIKCFIATEPQPPRDHVYVDGWRRKDVKNLRKHVWN